MKNLTKKECQKKGWIFLSNPTSLYATKKVSNNIDEEIKFSAKSLITLRKKITDFER